MKRGYLLCLGILLVWPTILRADMLQDIAKTEAALAKENADLNSWKQQNHSGYEFARDNLGKPSRFGVENFMAESQGVRDWLLNYRAIDRKLFPARPTWRGTASALSAEQKKIDAYWAKQLAAEKKKKLLKMKKLGITPSAAPAVAKAKEKKFRSKIYDQMLTQTSLKGKLEGGARARKYTDDRTQKEIEAQEAYYRARYGSR